MSEDTKTGEEKLSPITFADDATSDVPLAETLPDSPVMDTWKVVVVDDEEDVHSVTRMVLSDFSFEGRGLEFFHALSGAEATSIFESQPDIAVALIDVVMETDDAGLRLIHHVRNTLRNHFVRIVLRTGQPGLAPEREVITRYDVNDYQLKSELSSLKLFSAMTTALRGFRDIVDLDERRRYVERIQNATILTMATLSETRDNETGNHIRRTQHYVLTLANRLRGHLRFPELDDDVYLHQLFISAPLHDLGKIGIPDHILLKPGHLTEEEFNVMKTHTTIGHNAILAAENELGSTNSFLQIAREIALAHHEKWDGSGYPNGLSGHDIPLSARLMAVADVYDAIVSRRVYKSALPHHQAASIVRQGRGQHFDPDIVDAFLALENEFAAIAERFVDP